MPTMALHNRQHAYTPVVKESGRGNEGVGWERVGKGRWEGKRKKRRQEDGCI